MSFSQFILEQGVELELRADLKEVIALVDSEVSTFVHDGYGYTISSLKGVLGDQMTLLVKPWDLASATPLTPAVGLIEIAKLQDERVGFRIPPRDHWADDEAKAFDEDGRFFTSFVCQMINALQNRGLTELPGHLPVH